MSSPPGYRLGLSRPWRNAVAGQRLTAGAAYRREPSQLIGGADSPSSRERWTPPSTGEATAGNPLPARVCVSCGHHRSTKPPCCGETPIRPRRLRVGDCVRVRSECCPPRRGGIAVAHEQFARQLFRGNRQALAGSCCRRFGLVNRRLVDGSPSRILRESPPARRQLSGVRPAVPVSGSAYELVVQQLWPCHLRAGAWSAVQSAGRPRVGPLNVSTHLSISAGTPQV